MIPGLPIPLGLCMGGGDAGDTFYSQRVYDLFPYLPTAQSGTWTMNIDANSVFGNHWNSSSGVTADMLEWTVKVPAGNYKLTIMGTRFMSYGIVDLSIDGGAAVHQFDCYNGSVQYNYKQTSVEFSLTEGSHSIRLTKNGKNSSSIAYTISLQHIQLVKQDAGSAIVSPSNMPIIIDIPVVFADSHTNWNTLEKSTSYMFGHRRVSTGAQDAAVTFSFWGPKGNFTLAFLTGYASNRGIATVTVDGASIGTVDMYSVGLTDNNLNTSLTGTLAYTGVHTITFTMATKNASASAYYATIHHIQIRMNSITEPLSQDLAPEIACLWPTFAEANSDWAVVNALAAMAYYYRRYNNSPSLGDSLTLSSNVVVRPGTYRLDGIFQREISCGIIHVIIDGVDVGQIDTYHTGTGYNYAGSVSGIVLSGTSPHTVMLRMDSKNASSSNYYGIVTLARLVRTGA